MTGERLNSANDPGRPLARYDAARRALAEAHRIDEVKTIRDKAIALQAYARQAKDTTLITQATDIRMRAERRAGELLVEMKEHGERHPGHGDQRAESRAAIPKLSDLGISLSQSSRWQQLAEMEEGQFGEKVERAKKKAVAAVDGMAREAIREAKRARYAARVRSGGTAADLHALAASGERFDVIYADPPWEFKVYSGEGKQRSAERHYDTSPLSEILQLPVAPLAAENCALFLWSVWPEMPGALEVIKAWGFEYKTCGFLWVKQNPSGAGLFTGMGYWTRANTEPCLLATKGNPMRLAMDVRQVVMAPVAAHSVKPDEVRHRIERLLGGPYLELYGRKPVDGWTIWGNEIKRPPISLHQATEATA
jgi:N6-adenosine-specific RNA methylase IME4